MIDPESNYNKSRMQEWSDTFWGKTIYVWIPLLILVKMLGFYKTRKK